MSNGTSPTGRAAVSVFIYATARVALVVVLAAVIYWIGRGLGVRQFPIVIAMPLGLWVFGPLRRRATAGIDAATERRRRDREQLGARLRGEVPPEDSSDTSG